jgi:hypothetical protein
MNFFLIDALALSTRFGGSLIITQLEIRTESQLALENEFFSDRRLCPLDCSGLSYYQPARDSKLDPTRPDPTRPDPTRPDPTRPDPIRPDPTRPDPTRPDPTRPNPTRPDPTRHDPTRLEFEMFFSIDAFAYSTVRGSLNNHPARDSNREPTCIGKRIFF